MFDRQALTQKIANAITRISNEIEGTRVTAENALLFREKLDALEATAQKNGLNFKEYLRETRASIIVERNIVNDYKVEETRRAGRRHSI